MARLKQSIMSLGAKGTVGNALTFQRSRHHDTCRKKPTPTDPRSLAQLYHRWLYQDYLAMWAELSQAQKQEHKSAGSRKNMTGLAYFLQPYLKNLPDIAGIWHLDEIAGSVAHDSSKNLNHGTIINPPPVTGLISLARSFDGVDDRIQIPHSASLDIKTAITVFLFVSLTDVDAAGAQLIICKGVATPWDIRNDGTNIIAYIQRQEDSTSTLALFPVSLLADNVWFSVAFTYDGSYLRIYLNGELKQTSGLFTGTIKSTIQNVYLGGFSTAYNTKCLIDEARIYNRVLTQPQLQLLTERRYPE